MDNIRFYGHTPPNLGGEPTPGRLIVLEGTDGVGRSTQIGMLQEWLEAEGYAVLVTGFRRSELAATGIDRAMRGNTLDALTLNLFYATDFWDRLEKNIVPALRTGMVALVDRYIFSIIARARVRGVPARWLDDVFEFAVVPDRIIYLDVDVRLCCRACCRCDNWTIGSRARTFCVDQICTTTSSVTKAPCLTSSAHRLMSTTSQL